VEHADAGVALAVIEQPLAAVGHEPFDEDDVVDLSSRLVGRRRVGSPSASSATWRTAGFRCGAGGRDARMAERDLA
jgi:hypothetical protein